jgi:hypothetical protein
MLVRIPPRVDKRSFTTSEQATYQQGNALDCSIAPKRRAPRVSLLHQPRRLPSQLIPTRPRLAGVQISTSDPVSMQRMGNGDRAGRAPGFRARLGYVPRPACGRRRACWCCVYAGHCVAARGQLVYFPLVDGHRVLVQKL